MNPTDSTQPPAAESPEATSVTASTPKRAKLNYTLPNDRIAFAKQLDIIRAYAAAYTKTSAPVSTKEVGDIIGMAEATVAMANAFLTDVGLLTGEAGKFVPSPELMDYLRFHQFSADKAWSKLVPLFERSWFGQELITKLRFRPLSEDEAIADLAIKSNAEIRHHGQLKVGIDWLVQVGLVQREGGVLKLAQPGPNAIPDAPAAPLPQQPKTGVQTIAEDQDENLHKAILRLDAAGKRKVVIYAPPTVTKKELERINQWLSVQLIVEEQS